MTPRRLVSLIAGVLILSVLAPVGLSLWLAHRQAEKNFIEGLNTYSSRVALHAGKVTSQGKLALKLLGAFHGLPCSNEHLLMMRRVAYSLRYIQDVLWFNKNIALCSSLEQQIAPFPFPQPDKIFPDGYKVWFTSQNNLGVKRFMVALGAGQHVVMIDPASFIDVIPFSSWHINVAIYGEGVGKIINSSAPLDPAIIQQLYHSPDQHIERHGIVYIIHSLPAMDISIISWASTYHLHSSWYRQSLIWLPAGIILGLLSAAFLVRIFRHLQSPRQHLHHAIQNREIEVHYQPIIALSNGKIVGAEALARWPQSDNSYLSPEIFIPLAAEAGLSEALTSLILDIVFDEMADWLRQHPQQHISVNMEATVLASENVAARIRQLLAQKQLAPSQIALELTEREFVDPKTITPVIEKYRKTGHAIYLDDFGTGFSSLNYLQNLDVDILKIDKAFVAALAYRNVTPHIIDIAKALQLRMVAEGIETPQQEAWLRQHGVQYGQGWLYSKALPAAGFISWAEKNLRGTG
ncbi:TPA: EAL domain-containing protein [Citrobacter freundii]